MKEYRQNSNTTVLVSIHVNPHTHLNNTLFYIKGLIFGNFFHTQIVFIICNIFIHDYGHLNKVPTERCLPILVSSLDQSESSNIK